jgi:predicted transcriptional regulator
MSEVTVAQAVEHLGLTVRAGKGRLGAVVTSAQVSDLLSHVMARGKAGHFWITNQTHANLVAVAALTGLSAIAIAGGFEPEEEAVIRAEEEDIPLLTSPDSAYVLAGKLWELGVR